MDPLITNGIEPVMLRGLEKRADERDPVPRAQASGCSHENGRSRERI